MGYLLSERKQVSNLEKKMLGRIYDTVKEDIKEKNHELVLLFQETITHSKDGKETGCC